MSVTKETVEKVLSELDGPAIEVTVRRGGNLHLTFKSLKAIKALVDDNGEELQSRDEVIMRAQLGVKDALAKAGIVARISNSRLVDDSWVHSPSMWVNNTPRQGASAQSSKETAALKAEVKELKDMMAQFLTAIGGQAKSQQSEDEVPI
jgi:hypothetical protein